MDTNSIKVNKNFSNNTMIVEINSLLTDIISNIKNKDNNFIQDYILKQIILNYNDLNFSDINKDYNYLVYKGGNTINYEINNFLNYDDHDTNLYNLNLSYKNYIKNLLDTSKRSDLDFNYNVSLEQSKDLNKLKEIGNQIFNKIKNNDFDKSLFSILFENINYEIYLNEVQNKLRKIYDNNNINILGIYMGYHNIYSDKNINLNTECYKYYNDIKYINIKNKYDKIEHINKQMNKLSNILKLNNIIINYKDDKLYNYEYEDIPKEYYINIQKESLDNSHPYPFTNSYNKTLYFNGCKNSKIISQFFLIRKKIKFTFLYSNGEDNNIYYFNSKAELIDISINRSNDNILKYFSNIKDKNLINNINIYRNLSYIEKFQEYKYKQTNIIYNIVDIKNMLIKQSCYAWENSKYDKRLKRLFILIIILLLSNKNINCYLEFYYSILNILISNIIEFKNKYENIENLYHNKKELNSYFKNIKDINIDKINNIFNQYFKNYNIKNYILNDENKNICMIDSINNSIIIFIYKDFMIQYDNDINLKVINNQNYNLHINYIKYKIKLYEIILEIYNKNIFDNTLNFTQKNIKKNK